MQKKFEISQIKIKGGCQSGKKVVAHDSKSDLPLRTVFLIIVDEPKGTFDLIGCDSGAFGR